MAARRRNNSEWSVEQAALRIFDPEQPSAVQMTPAVEAPQPAPGPRVVGDPDGWVRVGDLVASEQDRDKREAFARQLQRHCGELAEAGDKGVEKRGGEWCLSPFARMPSGESVAEFRAVVMGQVAERLCGLPLGPNVRKAWLEGTAKHRRHLLDGFQLQELREQHAAGCRGLGARERDRRFNAEGRDFAAKHGYGHVRDLARAADKFRREILADRDPDQRGRPRHDQVAEDIRCTPEAWDHFKSEFLTPQRKSVQLCWILTRDVAEARGWVWPKYEPINRRRRRELPPSIADYTRLGPRRWEAKYQTYIQRDRVAQYAANECWICDHTRENFWSVSRGRWVRRWLTIWVDAATGRILSWARSLQPNSDIILATFYHAVRAHGAPLHVVFDNGKEFKARSVAGGRKRFDRERVDGVMGRHGIGVTYTEPYHGESKGVCEREFGVFGERLWKLIPTYCGANPGERPETLNADLKAGRISVPTEEEIDTAYTNWVEARNNEPREALGGRNPVEHYALNAIPRRTAPDEVLAELCLPETDCVVGRLGVQVRGHWYGQDELRLKPLFSQTVKVRFDPLDAERVSVFDQEGRFIVHCFNRRLRGVIQDDIREAKHRKKAAVKLVKEAHKVSRDSLASKTTLAQQVAAQRRYIEALAAQRIAVGAEGQADPRGVQLLPGAGEAAASLAALQRRSSEQRSVASAAERLAALGRVVESVEPAPLGFSYARFAQGCPDALGTGGSWGARERRDLAREREELLGTPSTGDEPPAGPDQFQFLRELGEDPDWQPPPPLKESLDDDDFAPAEPEPPAPMRNVLADLATGDETDTAAAHHVGQGGGYA